MSVVRHRHTINNECDNEMMIDVLIDGTNCPPFQNDVSLSLLRKLRKRAAASSAAGEPGGKKLRERNHASPTTTTTSSTTTTPSPSSTTMASVSVSHMAIRSKKPVTRVSK